MGRFTVKEVTRKDVADFILKRHYAGRLPSISYAFALYQSNSLVGALTIGKPASPPLCRGLAGEEYSSQVYELNRLVCVDDTPNILSWFVGQVFNLLKDSNLILVSFSDEGMNHFGYIYQATNWWYTGRSPERTDKYMPGNKHPRHYTEEFSHLRKVRTAKHRYIYVPNKRLRKTVRKRLNYPILTKYPKGESGYYEPGDVQKVTVLDTRTGERYTE